MQLVGATVVVTGGASGLGRATAGRLADLGARVLLVDLPTSDGAGSATQLGAGAKFVAADITAENQVNAALDIAVDMGNLRGVVHCAGRGGDRMRIIDKAGQPGPLDSFAEVIRVNLVGTYNVLRLSAARLADNDLDDGDRGAIVLTASVAAFDGQIGQTAYTAAKAGVHALTLVAARDLASRQIRVNTIAPGIFDTPMLGRLDERVRDSLAATVVHPKRLGQPADYADLAVQMLSNSYLNGETVRLDGAIRMAPRLTSPVHGARAARSSSSGPTNVKRPWIQRSALTTRPAFPCGRSVFNSRARIMIRVPQAPRSAAGPADALNRPVIILGLTS